MSAWKIALIFKNISGDHGNLENGKHYFFHFQRGSHGCRI